MVERRQPGMDHALYPYSALPTRPALAWPGQKRLAVWVVLHLEHWPLQSPTTAVRDGRFRGEFGNFFPDYRTFSTREYGNRGGIFRVLEVLDRHKVPVTVAANAALRRRRPELIEACLERGYEIAAHGDDATRMISSRMSTAEEEDYINQSLEDVRRVSGRSRVGWIGQDFGESTRTPQLLARAGVDYLGDWPNDDQPYWLTVDPPLLSLPYHVEWDDATLMAQRQITAPRYSQFVAEAADRMALESAPHDSLQRGRMMSLGLHPWVIGQPQRIRYLDRILDDLCARQDLWFASAQEIADCYRAQSSAP